jgi:hypothetical protein
MDSSRERNVLRVVSIVVVFCLCCLLVFAWDVSLATMNSDSQSKGSSCSVLIVARVALFSSDRIKVLHSHNRGAASIAKAGPRWGLDCCMRHGSAAPRSEDVMRQSSRMFLQPKAIFPSERKPILSRQKDRFVGGQLAKVDVDGEYLT